MVFVLSLWMLDLNKPITAATALFVHTRQFSCRSLSLVPYELMYKERITMRPPIIKIYKGRMTMQTKSQSKV